MTQEIEEFKPIEGYEGIYEISSLGNVRIIKTGKFKKNQTNNTGYSMVVLWHGKQAKGFLIHRLVAKAFIPNPDNLSDVNHKNGIKTDNRADNLEWLTRSQNHKHAYDIGLKKPSNQILTLEQVRYIKENPMNLSRKQLAEKFNVSYWCICDIYQNKSFKEVA